MARAPIRFYRHEHDHRFFSKLLFVWTVARALQHLAVSPCMMLLGNDSEDRQGGLDRGVYMKRFFQTPLAIAAWAGPATAADMAIKAPPAPVFRPACAQFAGGYL